MSATSYPRSAADWQGVFIRNIASSLASRPDTSLSLWAPDGPRDDSIQYACTPADSAWLETLAERGGIAHLLNSSKPRAAMAGATLLYRLGRAYRRASGNTDLFHVNWLQNALPLLGLPHPAVISVLGTDFKMLKLPGMSAALRTVLRGRSAVITPNADWMCEELETRFGDLARIQAVPFGIDDRWYAVQRVPVTPARWLAVVRVTRDKIGPLFEWGESLFSRGHRELHLIGPNQGNLAIPEWVHFHGAASPEDLAAQWFPAAAGLITLSQHSEGRPQVMLEAMAAGLPIIASSLPAHVDFIEDGRTGRIVENPDGLAAALGELEEPAAQSSYAANCRQFAYDQYGTWRDCASRYHELYGTLMQ